MFARRSTRTRSSMLRHTAVERIELIIETFGVHRLVYGSDMPVVDPRPTLDAVRGFGDSVSQILQIDTPGALLR